jgi:hypothetical protein
MPARIAPAGAPLGPAAETRYHAVVGGRPKALGKADLLCAIELSLPEQAAEPETPVAENGSRLATFLP